MTKLLTIMVRCLAAVALAMILPLWVTAVPVVFLSAALAIAVESQFNSRYCSIACDGVIGCTEPGVL